MRIIERSTNKHNVGTNENCDDDEGNFDDNDETNDQKTNSDFLVLFFRTKICRHFSGNDRLKNTFLYNEVFPYNILLKLGRVGRRPI